MHVRQFIAELKGRGVYQTTAFYAAGAWALLQVADIVFPLLDLPDWAITAVLVVAAAGFPVALVLSWLFDITPQGVVEAKPVSADGESVPWSRTHIIEFTLIILLAALVGFLYLDRLAYRDAAQQRAAGQGSATPDRASIAVLPFANLSDEEDMDYLGDGLAEEILNLMSKLNELNVAARTSSFYFKDRDLDIREIGEQLGVDYLLEGGVRYQQGRVRVTAKLIKSKDGFHLWSDTYDRELRDVLAVQEEIASRVVETLQIILPATSREAITRGTDVDPVAYDFYLRGRSYLRLPADKSNLNAAVDLFNRSLQQDQRFADAFAGLCDAYLGLYYTDRDVKRFEAAEAACHRALTLDRRAANVYIALGSLYRASGQYEQAVDEFNLALSLSSGSSDAHVGLGHTYKDAGRLELAEEHYRQAIKLQPYYWDALMSLANFLFATNRVSEAIPYYERICTLMPDSETAFNNLAAAHFLTGDFRQASEAWQKSLELSPSAIAYSNVASSLFFQGRFEEAVALYHKAVELAPEDYELWGNLGDAYRHSSLDAELAGPMYDNAIKLASKHLEINTADANTLALVAHYHAALHQREAAMAYLNRAREFGSGNMYVDYNTATALSALGETGPAMMALERALASGYPWHIAAADANLEALREEPGFEALGNAER